MKTIALAPDAVKLGWRARLDCGDINDLAGSIAKVGQLQPIVVSQVNGGYQLIAGARRIQACRQLQRKVEALVATPRDEAIALDMQIEENRSRKDFDRYELALAIHRRKQLYEDVNPETKHGATGRGRPKPEGAAPSFAVAEGSRRGWTPQAINEYIQIANLPAKKRREIEQTKPGAERNKIVQEALKEIRLDNRRKQLRKEAEQRKQLALEEESKPPVHVYHEDCIQMMKKLPRESVDIILTDPPYDRERSSIAHAARASINAKAHAWDKLDVGWVMHAAPLLVPGGHLLAFCPLEAVGEYELAVGAAGLTYRTAIVWCRTNPAPPHRPTYVSAVEAIVWAVKPGKTPFFEPWRGTGADYHPMNWFESPICGGNERIHPTQKPLAVILKLLGRHSSAELGHRVLDPFAGSGTTGVACRQRGQSCTLIEQEEKYVDMIRTRLAAC